MTEMGDRLEFWSAGATSPSKVAALARRLEEHGWDGLALVDSQNLAPDPYVLLGLAAAATERLGLATGVTNPLTRHPAAAAAAIATVQAASRGRAVLGIGRGDSSLAHLGLAPATPAAFERYLTRLQGYLRGEDVPFETDADGAGAAPASDRLGMAGGPTASRLHWAAAAGPKVPVDVAATGPRVIAVAARLADRVTFAVGSDPRRVEWAVDQFRRAREEAGLSGPASMGAYLPVMVNPDRDRARTLIAGGVASFARFSVMHGRVTGPAGEESRAALEAVHDSYDMNHHFTHGSPQSQGLTAAVVDEFGIAGPPGYCIERLRQFAGLGLTRVVVMPGGRGVDPDADALSRRLLAEEVLPAMR